MASRHMIVHSTPLTRLRDFSERTPPTSCRRSRCRPRPPTFCASSTTAPAQSQMQTLRAVGPERLHAIDWTGATAATEDATIYAALHRAKVNTLTIAGWAPLDR
jgi:hypothetical protein